MRVISGYLKGREILGYNIETTRPTMARVKESMFASIQNNIKDSVVLDLFCGSGSLGIEAISMGSSKCYFVDNNRDIVKYLKRNIDNLNIKDKSIIIDKDYKVSLKYFYDNSIKFDIVLVDAPYQMKVMGEIIDLITKYNLLNTNGLLVLEYSFDILKDKYETLELIKNKKYSDKFVNIYRKVID